VGAPSLKDFITWKLVTTRVMSQGPFYACKHARTHTSVFVDISPRIPAEDGGRYLALDSVTYQAS
jgi:hypothetical protein